MNSTFKLRLIEITRVFILGALMLFLSSKVQFLWIVFMILLIIGLFTKQFTYITKFPIDIFKFKSYKFYNLGFFTIVFLVFGYNYFNSFFEKTLIEKIYWPIYIGSYLFSLRMTSNSISKN